MDSRVLTLARNLWIAFAASVCLYGAIAFVAVQPAAQSGMIPLDSDVADPNAAYIGIFTLLAVATFLLAFIIPKLIARTKKRSSGESGGQGGHRGFVEFIVQMAFLEAGAIYGLVLAFLTQDPNAGLPLQAVALILMVVCYPSRSYFGRLLGERRAIPKID